MSTLQADSFLLASRAALVGSYSSSVFSFSVVAVLVCIPTNSVEHSLFSTASPAFIVCRLFNDGHSDWCEVVPHCSFDLDFSNI